MLSNGVGSYFVKYFMGHTVDINSDIQSLGIRRLRDIYSSAGLCIRERTKKSEIETIKAVIRAYGRKPRADRDK